MGRQIEVSLLLATRPLVAAFDYGEAAPGLATFIVEVPVYVWTELLTHKRAARNASSSRAQSHKRHAAMGWYTPEVFHEQGTFMEAGAPLAPEVQAELHAWWEAYHERAYSEAYAKVMELEQRGIRWAKEEVNRLLPTTKMMRGVITATEPAWQALLHLRTAQGADNAMRYTANAIALELKNARWWYSDYHIPFDGNPRAPTRDYAERAHKAAAQLARVSGGQPGPGQRPDAELAEDLLRERHYSPFEHIARWTDFPFASALAAKPEDLYADGDGVWGWENFRAEREAGEEEV